ncbi:GNAT family N-acetyltransferase [Lichenihabitans psoromatis]|uniref:GNAT family N-acetyltransferase n=1 Tax=Lichenihabitans psoromatis TaxID=2528642 RepID=UPI001036A100|nr:GNAT family N-acetyltransferase [Lichenihabitans psoromatis]
MSPASFDSQPTLAGDSVLLRPLRRDDLVGLQEAARNPDTWAGHPVKDRFKPEVFEPHFDFLLASHSTLAVSDRASGHLIGCSRYYVPPDHPDGIAIGFTFLDIRYWGGNTNLMLKRLMLGHAFATFDAVWFHIDPTNIRSQKATAKFGARHIYDADLDLSGKVARWMCFRLARSEWELRFGQAG